MWTQQLYYIASMLVILALFIRLGHKTMKYLVDVAKFIEDLRSNHLPHIHATQRLQGKLLVKICKRLRIEYEEEEG